MAGIPVTVDYRHGKSLSRGRAHAAPLDNDRVIPTREFLI
jgi:hypothetical protein